MCGMLYIVLVSGPQTPSPFLFSYQTFVGGLKLNYRNFPPRACVSRKAVCGPETNIVHGAPVFTVGEYTTRTHRLITQKILYNIEHTYAIYMYIHTQPLQQLMYMYCMWCSAAHNYTVRNNLVYVYVYIHVNG